MLELAICGRRIASINKKLNEQKNEKENYKKDFDQQEAKKRSNVERSCGGFGERGGALGRSSVKTNTKKKEHPYENKKSERSNFCRWDF
jgi:hypothetical protein